jgi:alpha-beta hydrolase superfamily lysophospholipase
MPEVNMEPQSATFTLTAADGLDLFVYRWLPPGPCKAIVQVVHGLAEHSGRYARLADALTTAGYGVYSSDHRGHGRTCKSMSKDQLGFFAEHNGWRLCLDDLWQINRHIAAEHPRTPIVLLGHSMGSTMARQFIGEHGDALAGVVLSGPNGMPTSSTAAARLITRTERLRLGARGHSSLLSSLTFAAYNKQFAPARTPFDWLSRDPAEVDKYVADPLCGFAATVQLWIDLLDGWAAASTLAHHSRIPKTLPIYVIAGSRDPVGGNTKQLEPMLAAYRSAGFQNVQHRFYPDARHELFNETNREEVTQDLLAWLDGVVDRKVSDNSPATGSNRIE